MVKEPANQFFLFYEPKKIHVKRKFFQDRRDKKIINSDNRIISDLKKDFQIPTL